MGNSERDIFILYDPFIEVGESLQVNVNKRRAYWLAIGMLIIILVLISSPLYEGEWYAIIFASIAALFITIICIALYLKKNPVLVVDEKGVILKNKFYNWECIESVKNEKAEDAEGSDHIKFYLKDGKPVYLNLEPFLFLDQKPKVIAAHIIKYFKAD